MADIVLAEFNGNVWLVGGERHIDNLLANTLPSDVTIELIVCGSKDEMHALWLDLGSGAEAEAAGDPWLIHPGIVRRIKRGSSDWMIVFQPWSAMLDRDALGAIEAAAAWAGQNPGAAVILTDYPEPADPQMAADLTRLRRQMIEAKLVESGLARERIDRQAGDPASLPTGARGAERIDIVIRPA